MGSKKLSLFKPLIRASGYGKARQKFVKKKVKAKKNVCFDKVSRKSIYRKKRKLNVFGSNDSWFEK